jgi:outer membrane phospholipase A
MMTSADGRYQFVVQPGRYRLFTALLGYGRSEDTVNAMSGQPVIKDFQLPARRIDLENVVPVAAQIRSVLFTLSEPNYFISGKDGFHNGTGYGTTRSLNQIKFRVALRYKVFSVGDEETGIYASYRQNSFWHLYESSAPFFDSNYNPQVYLYLDSDDYPWRLPLPSVRGFVQHESNGRDGTFSRGWNRIGLGMDAGDFRKDFVYGHVSWWRTFSVEETNPDIADRAGRGEFSLNIQPLTPWNRDYRLGDLGVSLNTRIGGTPFVPSTEVNFFISSLLLQHIRGLGLSRFLNSSIVVQIFDGTAENLLTYSDRHRAIRIGLATVR